MRSASLRALPSVVKYSLLFSINCCQHLPEIVCRCTSKSVTVHTLMQLSGIFL